MNNQELRMRLEGESVNCKQIKYLDCKNYYDLGAQLVTIIMGCIIVRKVFRHYLNLRRACEASDLSEYQKSVRRKMKVHQIQIFYLSTLILSTVLSVFFFIPYVKQIQKVKEMDLDKIYKISENLFISALNLLNLTVGFLYWKAMRGYYVLSDLPVPLMMRPFVKAFFFLFYSMDIASIIISFVWAFLAYISSQALGIYTLITTILSILACVGCRAAYRNIILTKLELSKRAVEKEILFSTLLFISSGLRILLYFVEIFAGDSWYEWERNFDQNCIDSSPVNAIVTLFIGLIINLLPAVIYFYLFMSEAETQRKPLLENQSDQ